jgi:periodic tryptophan protein 2
VQARRDIRGGRLATDRRTVANSSAGQAFTALAYSADGSFLFAAGTSKWLCVYDTEELVLLRRFQLSQNLALDGVLDQLNSKNMSDAGPLDLLDTADNDADEELQQVLPPMMAGGAAGLERLPGALARVAVLPSPEMPRRGT